MQDLLLYCIADVSIIKETTWPANSKEKVMYSWFVLTTIYGGRWAKYYDFTVSSVPSRAIICLWLRQIIDLRESGKSRYFVITEFENCSKNSITKFVFIFQNHSDLWQPRERFAIFHTRARSWKGSTSVRLATSENGKKLDEQSMREIRELTGSLWLHRKTHTTKLYSHVFLSSKHG